MLTAVKVYVDERTKWLF